MNPDVTSNIQSIPLRIVPPPLKAASTTDLAAIPPPTFVRNAGQRALVAHAYIRASLPASQRNLTADTSGTTGNGPTIVGAPGSMSGTPGGNTASTTLQPVTALTMITMPPATSTGNRTRPGRRKPSIWKTVAIAGGVALLVVLVVT